MKYVPYDVATDCPSVITCDRVAVEGVIVPHDDLETVLDGRPYEAADASEIATYYAAHASLRAALEATS